MLARTGSSIDRAWRQDKIIEKVHGGRGRNAIWEIPVYTVGGGYKMAGLGRQS